MYGLRIVRSLVHVEESLKRLKRTTSKTGSINDLAREVSKLKEGLSSVKDDLMDFENKLSIMVTAVNKITEVAT